MHPFPPASKLQFLVGKQLEQISLGQWQISFSFEKGSINVEGELEHIDKAETTRRHNTEEDRPSPLYLHHLLGQTVRTIAPEPFCLTLAFDGGDLLRIFSDEGPYECGQIYDDEGKLTVF